MTECFECDGLTKGGGAYRDNWAVTDRGTRGSVMSRRPLEPLSGAMMIRTRQRLAEQPSEGYDPVLKGFFSKAEINCEALCDSGRPAERCTTDPRAHTHTRAQG
ncbi:hypothetical protein MRX96_009326 [Rhipicephalus microplus]